MDGIDKLYTFQKQAGKTGASDLLNLILGRYTKKVDKLLPKGKIKISDGGKTKIPLFRNGQAYQEVTRLNGANIALDTSLATAGGLAAKEGYDLVVGDDTPYSQADLDKAKTETTAATTTGDKGATTTGEKGATTATTTGDKGEDKGDDKGANVPKKSIYDSAVNWIKENPWLAAAIGAGGLGLGYYAFSDDEEEEEEEE